MRDQLERRLKELLSEFEAGQTMLAELEEKRDNLEKTLLRISGAIQVLEEELRNVGAVNGSSADKALIAQGQPSIPAQRPEPG
jgi:chromosome segregation ATPase